jgi:ankyrin repeat protein
MLGGVHSPPIHHKNGVSLLTVYHGIKMHSNHNPAKIRILSQAEKDQSLLEACQNNDFFKAKQMIEQKAFVDIQDTDENTALMLALDHNRFSTRASIENQLARMLIEAGASPDIPNKFGNTAFIQAFRQDDTETFIQLINASKNIDVVNSIIKRTLLDEIIKAGHGRQSYLAYLLKLYGVIHDFSVLPPITYFKYSSEQYIRDIIINELKMFDMTLTEHYFRYPSRIYNLMCFCRKKILIHL